MEEFQQPVVQQQPPQQVAQLPYQQHPDIIKQTLNQNEILKEIENALSGKIWDKKTSSWIVDIRYTSPMNERGVNDVMRLVIKPRVNKIFFLTNFDSIEIETSLRELGRVTINLLIENCDDYKMEENQISLMIRNIKDLVRASYNRAAEDWERRHMFGTQGVLDIRQGSWGMPTKQERSIWGGKK